MKQVPPANNFDVEGWGFFHVLIKIWFGPRSSASCKIFSLEF